MSKPSPEIEAKARERLAADEQRIAAEPAARITGSRRTSQTLGQAWADFWRHPSPWLIGTFLLGARRLPRDPAHVQLDRADRPRWPSWRSSRSSSG